MIIYKIVNNINGKIYIGQTQQRLSKRTIDHIYRGKTPVEKALKKYGLQSFTISVIDEADEKSILDEKEKYWISFYKSKPPDGYNMTTGGEGRIVGWKHSDTAREKMSRMRTGVPRSDEFRRKLSIVRTGAKHSEETLKKMSVSQSLRQERIRETRSAINM